jgi:hypothetical protein
MAIIAMIATKNWIFLILILLTTADNLIYVSVNGRILKSFSWTQKDNGIKKFFKIIAKIITVVGSLSGILLLISIAMQVFMVKISVLGIPVKEFPSIKTIFGILAIIAIGIPNIVYNIE